MWGFYFFAVSGKGWFCEFQESGRNIWRLCASEIRYIWKWFRLKQDTAPNRARES